MLTVISQLFDKEAFSDVTIRSSSRFFKAHKVILCSQSAYFTSLLGPDSKFAESRQSIVELKDDDPAAIGAMLAWFYTFEYDKTKPEDVLLGVFHLHVLTVADKYDVPSLKAKATESF